jgi:uncharacterized protein (DUF1697 family)
MRWFGFLRAVNLGKRQMKMDKLARELTALGFDDVSTFIASGNCSFESPEKSAPQLERAIEAHLATAFGFEVETFLRTDSQLRKIARTDPFPGEFDSGDTLYVVFLRKAPSAAVRTKIRALSNATDRFDVRGAEMWHLIHGKTMDSTVPGKVFDGLIATSTARNVNTIRRMADKFDLA